MRNMGNSGKTAVKAVLAALALLVLTGITLHETVFMWFLAAGAAAYVACVAELLVRRRHKTLAASGIGSILFIAFGIAFLRQWGLAFNPDPEALSAPVDSEHPDLYFYLAALFGAATMLLLFAGTVLPGKGQGQRSPSTARRRPATRPVSQRPGRGQESRRRPGASRGSVPRPSPQASKPAPARAPAPRPSASTASRQVPTAKAPAKAPVKAPVAKMPAKTPAKARANASARPSAPTARR